MRMLLKLRAAAAFAVVFGLVGAGAPAALAETVTSPTGIVTVSGPSPVTAGLKSTYTLAFTNTTPVTMFSVNVQSQLPDGITVGGIGNCANVSRNSTTSINCNMPSLAPGASESATFDLLPTAIGTFDIPFTATGAVFCSVPGCAGSAPLGDSVTLPVSAQAGPTDVQVTGSSNNGSPPVGSQFLYTYQVKNNGPLPAFGVTFDDTLPSAILLVGGVSVSNGSCTQNLLANSVSCNIGSLPVGQQSVISFPGQPTATGVFANTGTAAMTGTDTQPANNSFTVTVQPK